MAADEAGAAGAGRQDARRAATEALVYCGITILAQVAVIVALAKRDELRRLAALYRHHVLQEWRGAHERRLVAELRRDLSRMDHEGITADGR